MRKKCQWIILQAHVYHVITYLYAITTLNYNKVMHIIPETDRVAIIVKHK